MVRIKRVYDRYEPEDGRRILIDRLWPRGINKEDSKIDEWIKEIAPSTELRKWFSHDVAKWPEFRRRYKDELAAKSDLVKGLAEYAKKGTITLLFAAKDTEHVNAAVLKEVIDRSLAGARADRTEHQKPRKRLRHSRLRIREQEI